MKREQLGKLVACKETSNTRLLIKRIEHWENSINLYNEDENFAPVLKDILREFCPE